MNDPAFIHSAALSANSTGLEVEGLQVDTGARPQKGHVCHCCLQSLGAVSEKCPTPGHS